MKRLFYIISIIILSGFALNGQTNGNEKFVQVSGIIIDEFYRPVPGVSVISKKNHKATMSERTGIYSIISTPGDTVFFRAMGFKRYHTIIPQDFAGTNCKVDILLETDTIHIEEVTILPWKTYRDFIKDVTQEKEPDPVIENMNDNLASIYVAISNEVGVSISPEAGYRYAMEQNFNAMATKSQYASNNLLNPFAWAKFVKSLKYGLLKNKDYRAKPEQAKVRKKIKSKQK
ncbi:MAG TPA: carboxypeptidase-like regulatory domain-containing protein [Bacteroidales bacterium]|nr:carboxypeptidase-like regulatory domain-containing protein [Bacteroidales bacterium]